MSIEQKNPQPNPLKNHLFNVVLFLAFVIALYNGEFRTVLLYMILSLQVLMLAFFIRFRGQNKINKKGWINAVLSILTVSAILLAFAKPSLELYVIYYMITMNVIQTGLNIYHFHIKKETQPISAPQD